MKKTIKCIRCSLCAIGYETGFTGGERLFCTSFEADVTREDGCTMGKGGEPQVLGSGMAVELLGHEAVYGFHDE